MDHDDDTISFIAENPFLKTLEINIHIPLVTPCLLQIDRAKLRSCVESESETRRVYAGGKKDASSCTLSQATSVFCYAIAILFDQCFPYFYNIL